MTPASSSAAAISRALSPPGDKDLNFPRERLEGLTETSVNEPKGRSGDQNQRDRQRKEKKNDSAPAHSCSSRYHCRMRAAAYWSRSHERSFMGSFARGHPLLGEPGRKALVLPFHRDLGLAQPTGQRAYAISGGTFGAVQMPGKADDHFSNLVLPNETEQLVPVLVQLTAPQGRQRASIQSKWICDGDTNLPCSHIESHQAASMGDGDFAIFHREFPCWNLGFRAIIYGSLSALLPWTFIISGPKKSQMFGKPKLVLIFLSAAVVHLRPGRRDTYTRFSRE